jgi:hypothetical protein
LYDDLSEVSENIYNKTLARDNNYTPINVSSVNFDAMKAKEAKIGESAFHHSAETIFDNESHVLIDARKYTRLPEGKFINLDFEANMSSILRSAIIDMRTAASVKQMQGFFGSSFYGDIFSNENERVGKMIFERVQGLVLDTRGKQPLSNKEFAPLINNLQKVSNFAAAKTLGSAAQPVKQVLPVMGNTLMNAGNLDLSILWNKDMMDFLNRSGETIALRGADVMGSVVDMDEFSKMGYLSGEQTKIIGQKLNNFYINNLLVKPDVYIARASWITYYKQKMKQLGHNTSDIDWKTHEVNREAAAHAQAMVDRQQNVSDASLLGEFLKSRDPLQKLVRGALFPFSNFMFNQKMRIWTDVAVLTSNSSNVDDKKMAARSLSGAIVEQFMFHALSFWIRSMMWNAAHTFVGATVTDDDEAKRWQRSIEMYKGNFVRDLISPFPVVDDIVLSGIDNIVELPDWLVPYHNYTSAGDAYGVYGIGWDKAKDMVALGDMMIDGKFSSEFAGRKTTKYLYSEDRDVAEMAALTYAAYLSGVLPADFGSFSRDIKRILEKWAVSESPLKRYEEKINQLPRGVQQTGGVSRWSVGETVDQNTRAETRRGVVRGGYSSPR